jgi:hypothetical protein
MTVINKGITAPPRGGPQVTTNNTGDEGFSEIYL